MFAENLREVNARITRAAKISGRVADEIVLVAVTKKISAEQMREAYNCGGGIRNFAENYVQEAVLKQSRLSDLEINWHFIGHVQSNKAKILTRRFSLIHSLDREKIISEFALQINLENPQDILIEVNLAGEASKNGCSVAELPYLIECAQKNSNLRLRGLMFMSPANLTEKEQHLHYSAARKIRDKMESLVSPPHSLVDLSMGTSHDFEVAICEGATIVRLGTVLFGSR